jgi:hypothetical protein
MYTPLINLDKYETLLDASHFTPEKIDNHIRDIKNQAISQIIYLPSDSFLGYDSIAFFDRATSVPLTKEIVEKMRASRKFTLSNYGFYMLVLKLSYHFTRIQEKVDRAADAELHRASSKLKIKN